MLGAPAWDVMAETHRMNGDHYTPECAWTRRQVRTTRETAHIARAQPIGAVE